MAYIFRQCSGPESTVHRPAERPAGAAVWGAVNQRAERDGAAREDQAEG